MENNRRRLSFRMGETRVSATRTSKAPPVALISPATKDSGQGSWVSAASPVVQRETFSEDKLFALMGERESVWTADTNTEENQRKRLLEQQNSANAKERDWNEEFQRLVDSEDSYDKFKNISALAQDFVFAAESLGRIIIAEINKPPNQKTIPPQDDDDLGVIGDENYVSGGILFRFAVDYTGMYKGDEFAMKAASHDLHGLMHYMATGVKGLHFPLMALIDLHGYRLIANSILPISENTVCYGSPNGGVSVHSQNEEFNLKMKEAAKILNIKGHVVGLHPDGANGKILYSAGDTEGHIGTDGRMYLTEFTRYCPPEPPNPKKKNRGVTNLYHFLRPEMVRKNQVPLSPDAFSGMGVHNSAVHRKEIVDCYNNMLNAIIPSLGSLESNTDSDQVMWQLHHEGINIRFIGKIRQSVTNSSLQQKILLEMIVRVLVKQLDRLLRRKTTGWLSETPYKKTVCKFLNLIASDEDNSTKFWSDPDLKKEIEHKFEDALTEEEKSPQFDLRSAIVMKELVARFVERAGIVFSSLAQKEFKEMSSSEKSCFKFVESDIQNLNSRVKQLNLVDYATGMSLFLKAKVKAGNDALRLLSVAAKKLSEATLTITNVEAMRQLAAVYVATATIHLVNNNHPPYEKALLDATNVYDHVLHIHKDVGTYIELGKVNARFMKLRGIIGEESKNAEKYYNMALEMNSPRTSEILFLRGSLHLRCGINYHAYSGGKEQYLLAIADFRKSLEMDQGNAKALYNLANAYMGVCSLEENVEKAKEYRNEAQMCFVKVISQKPEYIPKIVKKIDLSSPALWGFIVISQKNTELKKHLFDAVKEIAKLNLSNATVTDTELPLLLELIKQCSLVKVLNLSSLVVDMKDFTRICASIPAGLTLLQLRSLQIPSKSIQESSQYMKDITALDLRLSSVSDNDIAAITKQVSHLDSLKLAGCTNITDAASEMLALNSKTTLKTLKLSFCAITAKSANSLKMLEEIRCLKLAGCQIEENALLELCHSLKKVVKLDLAKNALLNNGESFFALNQHCPSLELLRLPYGNTAAYYVSFSGINGKKFFCKEEMRPPNGHPFIRFFDEKGQDDLFSVKKNIASGSNYELDMRAFRGKSAFKNKDNIDHITTLWKIEKVTNAAIFQMRLSYPGMQKAIFSSVCQFQMQSSSLGVDVKIMGSTLKVKLTKSGVGDNPNQFEIWITDQAGKQVAHIKRTFSEMAITIPPSVNSSVALALFVCFYTIMYPR